MTALPLERPANFTRRSTSFIAKFAREGRYHFIPLYLLLQLSDFAREGMEHSGSYRFADHLYRGIPSGWGWLGRRLDAALIKLPAARAMRQRCFEARDAMGSAFRAHISAGIREPFRIVTIPCGLPRDVRDFAAQLAAEHHPAASTIAYTGIDLDPRVINAAAAFLAGSEIRNPCLKIGNALDASAYPEAKPHFIASTGLGEFLDDTALECFYRTVFDALAPGGTFFTSVTAREPRSDAVLRAFELHTHYRTGDAAGGLLARQPWESVTISREALGLQTFVRARKARSPFV